MTSKLREMIPGNKELQRRFDARLPLQQGYLLGCLARIDSANKELLRYYPLSNELWMHTMADADFISSLNTVMQFFDGAFAVKEAEDEQ